MWRLNICGSCLILCKRKNKQKLKTKKKDKRNKAEKANKMDIKKMTALAMFSVIALTIFTADP